MISTDRKIMQKGSSVQERMLEYASLFTELHIIIFSTEAHALIPFLQIGENIFVYTTSSKNKLHYIKDSITLGNLILENKTRQKVVITTQDPFETGIVGWWLSRKHKVAFNVQIHTDFVSPYFKNTVSNKLRAVIARFILPHATSIRVVSERIKNSISSFVTVQPVVFPIWTDLPKIENTCPLFYLHQKYPQFDHIILTVARLEKEKDISLSLAALEHVCHVYPKTGFIIVGQGNEKDALLQEIQKRKLTDNVYFEGWQSDVIQYYKTADLYLCTSLYEGFGLSLFEAAASDCPIVSTDVGLIGSILIPDESVKVVERSEMSIAEVIIGLLNDEEKLESMKLYAHKAVKKHSMTKTAYLTHYKKLLQ